MMKLWRGLSEDGKTVVLRRFEGKFELPAFATAEWLKDHAAELGRGAVVDVETTGLDKSKDRVIELGIRTFRFMRSSGQLVSVDESFSGMQDPGMPLSREIVQLTGLHDEDLKGRAIDWKAVRAFLEPAELIIAHNAAFDRPFIEKEIGARLNRVWACTFKQVPWIEKGYGVQKLEILSAYHGFFTDAHRALNDVDALLHLISLPDHGSGKPYLAELFANAHRRQVKVIASRSPFEAKDDLKKRGYRWDSLARVWSKVFYQEQLAEETAWLAREVYRGEFEGAVVEIPLESHFLPE